jgi:uncharacterized glyoxalase superfamily protein PhnB
MRANRSMPRSPVVPELVYADVREAVVWLCEAFGFAERWTAGGHRAQLAVGDAAVVVMADDGGGRGIPQSPITHGVIVRVEDVDAHHERAQLHGARILDTPTDFPYGERQYNAEDLAGHRWTFSQTIADVAPEDWGGQSGSGS